MPKDKGKWAKINYLLVEEVDYWNKGEIYTY